MNQMSELQKARLQFKPIVPQMLEDVTAVSCVPSTPVTLLPQIEALFPLLSKNRDLIVQTAAPMATDPLRVGIVLSGGQASGGHNVIAGMFDALHRFNSGSRLIGFLNGPAGIVKEQTIEITQELLSSYRNQGGFDMIGSGRTKIETMEQFVASLATVQKFDLDGLIVVGGDDSNTNAALLAEYFLANGCKTKVIGVPKTIDGDLQHNSIEMSFGFDTACKTYSETIGNICRDAISAKKYYYFIKLMGRSASHITLECALATQPNLALIGEEIQQEKKSLQEVVSSIADLIIERKNAGKEYGVILIPEGIIEFIEDCRLLITELNRLVASNGSSAIKLDALPPTIRATFDILPKEIQSQLLLDRDPHGNVQVSKIETEKLFIALVEQELEKRKVAGLWSGKFGAQPIFCGYEGRSCLPSDFDSTYCYALGTVAALLVARGYTGYIASLIGINKPSHEWRPAPVLLPAMMHMEERDGKHKPVIAKALVNLQGKPFSLFKKLRNKWRKEDQYVQPGPIQFWGPKEVVERLSTTITLGR